MKLILHIGTDKTGSTAIQKHLYINRQWLLARGVYIPLTGLGKDNGHGDLLTTMEPEQMTTLSEELAAAKSEGYESAVISWEGMCFMKASKIGCLVKMLRSDNLWVLVYLREQADIVQTGYLQGIKTNGNSLQIADFQKGPWGRSGLRALLLCYSPMRNYARLLRKWMRLIPKGHVIIREFQKDLLVNRNVVDDFLSVLGQFSNEDFVRIKINSNISLDVESAIIMNDIDRRDGIESPRKIFAFSLLSLIHSDGFGTRYFLPPRRVASIRRYYRRSNRAIGSIVGSPMPELFSNPPDCKQTYTPEGILSSVDEKRKRFSALLEIPMLLATRIPHETPAIDLLVSGWSKLQDWGAWSSGNVSRVRFRAPFWMVSHENARLIIFLRGRYSGNNSRSKVVVNDLDFGWIDLRKFNRSIALPISALHTNQVVDLQLHHEFPGKTGDSDLAANIEAVSFGIEKFGIQISNPD